MSLKQHIRPGKKKEIGWNSFPALPRGGFGESTIRVVSFALSRPVREEGIRPTPPLALQHRNLSYPLCFGPKFLKQPRRQNTVDQNNITNAAF